MGASGDGASFGRASTAPASGVADVPRAQPASTVTIAAIATAAQVGADPMHSRLMDGSYGRARLGAINKASPWRGAHHRARRPRRTGASGSGPTTAAGASEVAEAPTAVFLHSEPRSGVIW